MGDTELEDRTLLEVDSRGRVSLGRLGGSEGRRYLARRHADGTIVMEPAVVLSELEARLHANPTLHAELIAAAAAEPGPDDRPRRRRTR